MKPKEIRRAEANARNTSWAQLTPAQQLESLNARFPDGAKRQKERLQKHIDGGKPPEKTSHHPEVRATKHTKLLRREQREAARQARIHKGGRK